MSRLPRTRPAFFPVVSAVLGFLSLLVGPSALHAQQRVTAVDSSLVNTVWSGHPVGFAFVSKGDSLYAAYYAGNSKRLTVSMRNPQTGSWKQKTLADSNALVGWDSHNFITMTFDAQGLLHISGNMHGNVLRYWRSDTPGEIDSLKPVASMVGSLETQVTYPVFIKGTGGDLIYMYRSGASGSGDQIINKWNPGSKTWSRLLGTALFSGASTTGTRSTYFGGPSAGPVFGPEGIFYHLFFFWRATADAATTHRVSYMRSTDLVNWKTSTGAAVTLPVSFDNNPGVIVDNVPQYAGLINRGEIGFDSQKRPIITYHKFDSTVAGGYTQCYNARLENGAWVIYKTTNWASRWSFGGTGSLVIQIQLGAVTLQPDGRLTQWYSHALYGRGVMVLNEATLLPDTILADAYWPKVLDTAYRVVNSTSTGSPLQMEVHWQSVRSQSDPSVVHALRWETWPENADAARAVSPPAGRLMYYRVSDPNVTSIAPPELRAGARNGLRLRVVNGRVTLIPDPDAAPVDLQGRKISIPSERGR